MILEKTVELVYQIFNYHKILPPRVNQIVIGQRYSGVEVFPFAYDPMVGLAYTFPGFKSGFDKNIIKTKDLNELLSWSYEKPSIKKTLGIATLNAVSQHILQIKNPYHKIKGDISDHLNINKDTKITFIGSIRPMIKTFNHTTSNIIVVDHDFGKLSGFEHLTILDDVNQLEPEELSTDILFCTGSSLINDTFEGILDIYRHKAGKIILIGPTSSMLPDLFFDNGVNMVSGMKIFDSSAALRVIGEGKGTRVFKQYGKKYNLINE